MAHWTAQSTESFIRRITFDFWTQLQKRMEAKPLTQFELAQTFGVSESAVSQVLNNSKNPTLKTLVNYAKALNLSVAIVAYQPVGAGGIPVNSEIFNICWEKAGHPDTFGQADKVPSVNDSAFTSDALIIPDRKGHYISGGKQARTQQGGIGLWQSGADFGSGALDGMATTNLLVAGGSNG